MQVSYSLAENSQSMLYLMFENVPSEKLDLVKDKLTAALKRIADGEEKVDMKRMQTVIHRHVLESLSHLENNPHETIAFMVIGDILYGNTKEDVSSFQEKEFFVLIHVRTWVSSCMCWHSTN